MIKSFVRKLFVDGAQFSDIAFKSKSLQLSEYFWQFITTNSRYTNRAFWKKIQLSDT